VRRLAVFAPHPGATATEAQKALEPELHANETEDRKKKKREELVLKEEEIMEDVGHK